MNVSLVGLTLLDSPAPALLARSLTYSLAYSPAYPLAYLLALLASFPNATS